MLHVVAFIATTSLAMATRKYDAVVVPGGGLDHSTRQPAAWVISRLESALELDSNTRFYIVLSRGTPHRAPPRDGGDYPVDESVASARYLMEHGVSSSRIILDTWSLDTIGNAYFARTSVIDPLSLRSMCVVTSAFHAPRTRAIFDWVFGLDVSSPQTFRVDYKISPDTGMADDVLTARREKEEKSLIRLREHTIPQVQTMQQLAEFILVNHGAYNAEGCAKEREPSCSTAASSY